MLGRRILVVLLALTFVSAVGASLLAPSRPAPLPPAPGSASTAPDTVRRTLVAWRPPQVVTVPSRTLLELTVRARGADAVELQDIGTLRPIAAASPVTFDVLTDTPGDYPVVLTGAGRTIGTVRVVSPPR